MADVFKRRTSQMFNDQKRRAAKVHLSLPFTLADLRAWLDEQRLPGAGGCWRCAYCDCLLTEASLLLDHMTPLARKVGVEEFAFVNLAVVCRVCNEAKGGALDAGEFGELREMLKRFHPAALTDTIARLRAGNRRFARGRA